ncbi:flavodoxin domain-containing protein [Paractinoplanes brasiliensis]|uniref:Menaquinone-dependent protoporphyrinogen oxidase n=1 Tax=Paractinoplanes brasiliensis TaxID=52695 RepID=A0A4R6JKE3_9ACTN|nr:flavodoxin domain-containing protein [Actinoplanes brasiliensis]TDO36700.1 menaquinone-dependent protoporphyrinogen oxidase [Actinoplanes brasiliensis]GID32337.1 flavodoxin [Actinoplanes brasiliensis]
MSGPHTHVLVAFATRNGSTRQVAEFVGTVLHHAGAEVEVTPAHSVVGPVHGYDLVVLGAPIYSGRWHRDARRFLKHHRDDLSSVPIAVFALGPRHDDEEAWRRSRRQLDRALAAQPWLKPVSVALFGGADPISRRTSAREDLRDWSAIGAWARELLARPALQP